MTTFPADFADLERFADWAVPTERARYEKRLASAMPELLEVYDAAFPRFAEMVDHLDQFRMEVLGRCRNGRTRVIRHAYTS